MYQSPEARAAQYGRDVSQAWARGPAPHYPRDVQATELATMLRHAFTQGYREGADDTRAQARRDAEANQAPRDACDAAQRYWAGRRESDGAPYPACETLTTHNVARRQDGAW